MPAFPRPGGAIADMVETYREAGTPGKEDDDSQPPSGSLLSQYSFE